MLLSINPEYVEKILDGTKKFEYRKRKCSRNNVDTIIIYATSPIKKVVGEVKIKDVLVDNPTEIWQITNQKSGITKEFFDSYYKNREIAVAYKLGKVTKYKKGKSLTEYGVMHAPQSFIYID